MLSGGGEGGHSPRRRNERTGGENQGGKGKDRHRVLGEYLVLEGGEKMDSWS